jgi:hypothetical protein
VSDADTNGLGPDFIVRPDPPPPPPPPTVTDHILFQNTSTGQVSIREMNGNSLIGGGPVSPNPGPAWKPIGTGLVSANPGTGWRAVGLT